MRNLTRIILAIGLLLGAPAFAGDWEPNPAVKYGLVAPIENVAPSSAAEEKWVESLVSNLRKAGSNPNVVYRFARSTAKFTINGSSQKDTVYVSREDPSVFLVFGDGYAKFIVNFTSKEVSVNNYGGSLFIPKSNAFCVLVLDAPDWPPGGIPITSAPGNVASFEGRSVSWY